MRLHSRLAQAGLRHGEATGSISTPIYQSATFRHPGLGQSTGYDYSRTINPTREVLEKTTAQLEGGDAAFAFSSGMAAVTAVASLFSRGDHLVVTDDLYGGTYRLFEAVFSRFGITADYTDTSDGENIRKAVRENTKAIFVETPTNPMMKITDLRQTAGIAAERGIMLIVDNTFMTPYLQRPIEYGADIVIHSGTKYLGGHNDVLCGIAVTAGKDLSGRVAFIQNATGGVLSPLDSWLVLRGMKTLALRMERSQENAEKIAGWLAGRNDVTDVYYPGFQSGKGYSVQRRQADGYGGMISFRVSEKAAAERILNRVRLISFAESLGGVESLITYPCVQTHGDIPAEIRENLGITDTLLRLSVGIEAAEDLIDDLKHAMEGD